MTHEKRGTGENSSVQKYNVINLLKMHDFSKFCLKFGKVQILKKCVQTDFENDLATAD